MTPLPVVFASDRLPSWTPVSAADDDGTRRALAEVPVLIIEDEAVIAWVLESLLEDMGFRAIAIAPDCAQALAAAAAVAPALILSDINLGSGPDGIETVAQLAADRSIAIVFVSAYADLATRGRVEARIGNGTPLLSKPIRSEELERAIELALNLEVRH